VIIIIIEKEIFHNIPFIANFDKRKNALREDAQGFGLEGVS